VEAAEHYNETETPLNIGTGIGTTIRELVETLNEVTGFKGRLNWLSDKPDGAMRKVLDVTRMKAALNGWSPPTSLRAGLEKTVSWYRANKAEADAKW
jgi:GDP-L-fucose synthase